MSQTTSRTDARNELLSRLNRGAWAENLLIEAIVEETELETETIQNHLDRLATRGEVYRYNGVVKRT